jgi:hypothetical protein
MTPDEWRDSDDPIAMLRSLSARYAAQNKRGGSPDFEVFRKFACLCCRRIWDLLDEDHRSSLEMIEAYLISPTAGGLRAARRKRWSAGNDASNNYDRLTRATPRDRQACLLAWARNIGSSAVWEAAERNPVRAASCHRSVAEAIHSVALAHGAEVVGPDPGHIGYLLPPNGELAAQADLLRSIVPDPFANKALHRMAAPQRQLIIRGSPKGRHR